MAEARSPSFGGDEALDRALRAAFAPPAGAGPAEAPCDGNFPPPSVCRVTAELARGGMGVVYRARDPQLQREVALKLLDPELSTDAAAVERFLEEARVCGMLQHPGIVPVHACGRTQSGRPWFTMKLIEGRTLAALLAERPSAAHEQGRLLAIFESVCRTIAFAHARGVVHLDLKPGNVMVGTFGEVLVVDWGLSALLAGPLAAARERRGIVHGTPAYMPPEQARGEHDRLDGRADVFALGALLCEILTGAPPYAGGRAAQRRDAAEARLEESRERLGSVEPAELATLCRACLEPDPARRPGTAGELADALAHWSASLQARARAAEIAAAGERERARRERSARRWTAALATTVLVSVAAGLLGWSIVSGRERERRRGLDARAGEALGEGARQLGRAESGAGVELFAEAQAAAARAEVLLANGEGSEDLLQRAVRLRERASSEGAAARSAAERTSVNTALLARLEALRAPDEEDAYPVDPEQREGEYLAALEAAALPPPSRAAALAAAVVERGIAREFAGHVDEWIDARLAAWEMPGVEELREIERRLDPDPLRSRVREAIVGAPFAELARISRGPDLASCEPGTLHAFARALRARSAGRDQELLDALHAVREVHPQDYALTIELARQSFRAGFEHVAEGEQLYRLAQSLDPQRVTGYLELGWELEHLDLDYAAAADLQRRAVELRPDCGVAYFCLGRSLRALGDLDGALAAQGIAARLMAADERPRKELALLQRATGRLDEALAGFEQLLGEHPGYLIARGEYASALFERGRPEAALSELHFVQEHDLNGRSHWLRVEGLLLLEAGECAGAARILRGLDGLQELCILPLYEQGVRLQDYLDVDELLARQEAALRSGPATAESLCRLGALLDARGRSSAALVAFRGGHALAERQQAWSHPSRFWLERAERRAALEGELERRLAASVQLASADAVLELAGLAARKGLSALAVRWFEEAFARDPNSAREPGARCDAARAALRAAAEGADEGEARVLRRSARTWLRADLEEHRAELARADSRTGARRALGGWLVADELAAVREPAALDALEPGERADWEALWSALRVACRTGLVEGAR